METTGTQSNRKTITGLQCTVTDSFNSFSSVRVRSRRFVILLVRFRGLESVGNRHELGRSTNLRCIHHGTYTYEVQRHKFTYNQHANMQCSGSEAGSIGSVWPPGSGSVIYLYESGSFHQQAKKEEKNFDFYCFVTSLWLFIFQSLK